MAGNSRFCRAETDRVSILIYDHVAAQVEWALIVRQRQPCSRVDAVGKDSIAGHRKNGTMLFRKL